MAVRSGEILVEKTLEVFQPLLEIEHPPSEMELMPEWMITAGVPRLVLIDAKAAQYKPEGVKLRRIHNPVQAGTSPVRELPGSGSFVHAIPRNSVKNR